jgi:hypothetical protein
MGCKSIHAWKGSKHFREYERAHSVPVRFGAWQRALAACVGTQEAKFSSGRRKRLHGMPLENGIPKEVSQGRLLRVTVPRGSRF